MQSRVRRREFITLLGGAAVTWPRGSVAQVSTRRPLVAYLVETSSATATRASTAFLQRMQELGYVAGRDIDIVYRYADGDPARIPSLVDELVRLKPDVMVATNTQVAIAMKQATAVIPIVAPSFADPVAFGLVATHARPGGNVTGILGTLDTLQGKQLALAAEIVRGTVKMGMLLNAGRSVQAIQRKDVEAAATALAIKLVPIEVRVPDDLDAGFQAMARESVDGVIVLLDPMLLQERRRIATLAIAARLPSMFGHREHVEAGGLMSYGVDLRANYRHAADFVGKILKGAKPGELPVELPTKFDLVVNLKTAKGIGLTSLAQMRSADCIEQGPLSGATRKRLALNEFFSV
jgi:putative ABC transport system substrate-binding protein